MKRRRAIVRVRGIVRGTAADRGLERAIERAIDAADEPRAQDASIAGRVICVLESRRWVRRASGASILEPSFALASRAQSKFAFRSPVETDDRNSNQMRPRQATEDRIRFHSDGVYDRTQGASALAAIVYPAPSPAARRRHLRAGRRSQKQRRGW